MRICMCFRTSDVNLRCPPRPRKAPRPAPEPDKVFVPNNPQFLDLLSLEDTIIFPSILALVGGQSFGDIARRITRRTSQFVSETCSHR